MDGVNIHYNNDLIGPKKPAYFYYRSYTVNSPTLTIKSQTENTYYVSEKWIDNT